MNPLTGHKTIDHHLNVVSVVLVKLDVVGQLADITIDADTSKAGNYGYKLDCAVEVVGDLKVVGDAFGDRSCTTSVLTAPTSQASTWTFTLVVK